MDQTISTLIAAGVPTLAVIAGFIRNEAALAATNARISETNVRIEALTRDVNLRFETLTRDVNLRFETLTRDVNMRFETLTQRIDRLDDELRQWARITMQHNTDIGRLKDKTGLE